jgi:fructokinase
MQQRVLCFGEILFDVFPAYERLGGAPFNFAAHLCAFQVPTQLITRVGKDDRGRRITDALDRCPGTDALQIDDRHDTGAVRVQVDDRGVPEFDILSDVAYDYVAYDASVRRAAADEPALLYCGTLAQRNAVSRQTLQRLLAEARAARVFCDMNLRPPHFSAAVVEGSLQACQVVKLNEGELQMCKTLLGKSLPDAAFIDFLMARYQLEWLCLTRGERGSELYHSQERYAVEGVPVQDIVDTVGAGDAYASVLALGILNGWAPQTILARATEFSAALCGQRGAVPESPDFYEPFLSWLDEGGR